MRKVLPVLLLIAFVAAVVLLVAALRQPDTYHVERTAVVHAPPGTIFGEVNDLHRWHAWSPYVDLDPDAQYTFTGPAAGKGATEYWAGNRKMGEGHMTIEESDPDMRIRMRMNFVRPVNNSAMAEFTFAPAEDGTRVTWALEGQNTFMLKLMHLLLNPDKIVGPDFEKGLARLKAKAESTASTH